MADHLLSLGPELTDDAPVGAAIGAVANRRVPARVPAARYIDASWAEREHDRLWPKVWQLAGTIDHVAEPGDWFEYEIGPLSVLVLRDDEGRLRAFQNVCLHRGNILCTGSGEGLDEIRCPYHRWTWDLTGRLREVPSRRGFGALRNDDLPLVSVQVDTWGPLLFVNLDLEAEPLADFLGRVPDLVAWAGIDDYACRYDLSVPLPCNWKTLIEGFSETYHVQGIHREMLPSVDDVNSINRLHGRHGSLYQPYGIVSPRLRDGATDQQIWDSLMSTQGGRYGVDDADPGPVPERADGATMRDLLEGVLRTKAAADGWDATGFDQAQMLDLYQLNLFPNISVIVMADTITCLRARPGPTPDDAFMDVISLQRVPSGQPRPGKPMRATMAAGDASLGAVFDQDVTNLLRAQRGMHQPGFTDVLLSREEMRIMNLHRNLEEYLGVESDFAPETLVEIEGLRADRDDPLGS